MMFIRAARTAEEAYSLDGVSARLWFDMLTTLGKTRGGGAGGQNGNGW